MYTLVLTFVLVQFKKVLVADINIGYEEIVNTQVGIANGCRKYLHDARIDSKSIFIMHMFVGSCF